MNINKNKFDGFLIFSREVYWKVLEKFNIQDAKIISTPLGVYFNLKKDQSPKIDEDNKEMAKIPYAFVVGSLMYVLVCIRPDIAHLVGVVIRFMYNLGRKHWKVV